uniref:Uncharacterized protein n=1 Tax=Aegilops tauschii subsp. strangulata TaxID=200361 RepID=A0A453SBS8_AEGTS
SASPSSWLTRQVPPLSSPASPPQMVLQRLRAMPTSGRLKILVAPPSSTCRSAVRRTSPPPSLVPRPHQDPIAG